MWGKWEKLSSTAGRGILAGDSRSHASNADLEENRDRGGYEGYDFENHCPFSVPCNSFIRSRRRRGRVASCTIFVGAAKPQTPFQTITMFRENYTDRGNL